MHRRLLLLLVGALVCTGCMSGLIYQHTFEPLSTDFNRTAACTQREEVGAGEIRHLSIPLSQVNMDILWQSNAIGDVARREGIEEICYADMETLSILTIWNEYTVHVYGKPAPKKP